MQWDLFYIVTSDRGVQVRWCREWCSQLFNHTQPPGNLGLQWPDSTEHGTINFSGINLQISAACNLFWGKYVPKLSRTDQVNKLTYADTAAAIQSLQEMSPGQIGSFLGRHISGPVSSDYRWGSSLYLIKSHDVPLPHNQYSMIQYQHGCRAVLRSSQLSPPCSLPWGPGSPRFSLISAWQRLGEQIDGLGPMEQSPTGVVWLWQARVRLDIYVAVSLRQYRP